MKKHSIKVVCCYFYKQVWQQKPIYFFLLILSILQMAFSPFINIIIPKYMINELIGAQRIRLLLLYVSIMIVGNMLFQIMDHYLRESRAKYEDWFARFYEIEMSKKSMKMRFEYTESSEIMAASEKAVTGMSWYSGGISGLSDCIIKIISSLLTFIGIVGIVITISPWLILITIMSATINAWITSKLNAAQIRFFNQLPQINKAYRYLYRNTLEKQYAQDIRLYDAETMLLRKAKENADQLDSVNVELAKEQSKWSFLGVGINVLNYVFMFGYLGIKAIKRLITIGDFVMCISAIENFQSCLNSLILNCQEIQKKADFMKSYVDFMQIEDSMDTGNHTIAIEKEYLIEFRDVFFRYPNAKEYTLEHINLVIKPGEHLSVVGPNGAGKTTFIKLLCRLYDVTEGAILINGVDIREYKYAEYIKLLSVVFQDFKLFALSVKDNIQIGSGMKIGSGMEIGSGRKIGSDTNNEAKLRSICKLSGTDEMITKNEKGFDTQITKNFDDEGVEPSGGEAQKIAIARALYKDAPIIILDEPTAALDPIAEYEIYEHFNTLVEGKTAIYISHRMSSCKFCDNIAVFSDKTIKEYGPHDTLVNQIGGIYAKMFETQAQYYVQ